MVAAGDPTNQEAVDAALAYTTDAAQNGIGVYLEDLANKHQYGIPNSEIPNQLVITDGPNEVDGYPDVATMTYCEIDAAIILENKPDGTYTVINDDYGRRYWDAIFWWNGEVWQLASLELTDEALGVTSCDD